MTPNQPSAEVSNRLVDQFDARIWAEEYCKINPSADFGTMLGWFANAIMAGHDNALRKQDAIAQAAKDGEEIARLRAEREEWLEVHQLIAAECGNPDPKEACRIIIRILRSKLKEATDD